MTDRDDDILDVTLDDFEPDDGAEVIEVVLDEGAPAAPKKPRRPSGPASAAPPPPDDEADLPMIAAGTCPRCGYAFRPLETECPRCARGGAPLEEPPGPESPAPALPPASAELPAVGETEPLPEAPRWRGCQIAGAIALVVVLAAAVAIPVLLYLQPEQRAKREYQLGLQAQLRSQFPTAQQHYQRALELDPYMGLAAFSMGTTYLRIGDPALVQSMQQLTQEAAQGKTEALDRADEWFRRALQIGNTLPQQKRLMDQRIRTPAQLRAFARAALALTAFIRGAAMLQEERFDESSYWFGIATREAQAAVVDDPGNASAEQVLRSVGPLAPPAPGGGAERQ